MNRSLWFIGGCLAMGLSLPTPAQVIPDQTLGSESSMLVPDVDIGGELTDIIEGGAIRGGNLFQSFQAFNVAADQRLFFNNPAGIANIISRVTGNSGSDILGTLGVLGSADLFLINPNGILFGPNARLDVNGSFIASTANSVVFENGFAFSATNPQAPPLLTMNVPIGLQLGPNPGSIANQSRAVDASGNTVGLQVRSGKTIGLLGGDVTLAGGHLTAPQGRIELGAVASNAVASNGDRPVQVSLTAVENGFALGYDAVQNFAGIRLTQAAVADASGPGGGEIQVQAEVFSVLDGAQVIAITEGDQPGGTITLDTTAAIEIIGTTPDGLIASQVSSRTEGTGQAGDLNIYTARLQIDNGVVSAASFGDGDGGDLTVLAAEAIELSADEVDGLPRGLINAALADGNAGDLLIQTGRLVVRDGAAVISGTRSRGDGGDLTIEAATSVEVTGTSPDGVVASRIQSAATDGPESVRQRFGPSLVMGNAGDLTLDTPVVVVRDGAQILTGTDGVGNGGRLTVRATESVLVQGDSADGQFLSSLFSDTKGKGAGGTVTIETQNLQVADGGRVSTASFGPGKGGDLIILATEAVDVSGMAADESTLSARAFDRGNAGNLTIDTQRFTVRDGAQISVSTHSAGQGGNLTVNATEFVHAMGVQAGTRSGFFANVNEGGSGNGGTLAINTRQLRVQDGAWISATTSRGSPARGGTVSIQATESIDLAGTDQFGIPSLIFAETFGRGQAGDLSIATGQLVVRDGAQISASTFDSGAGGTLRVTADSVELSGTSADGFIKSGLFAASGIEGIFSGTGPGGDLQLTTHKLVIHDQAQLAVSSIDSGNAGQLEVVAQEIRLDNGQITGATPSGEGGNLSLRSPLILLRNGSQISATAEGMGNGGNITFQSDFILAIDHENSDIVANAFAGQGGNINITAEGVFGLAQTSGLLDASISEINASSATGIDGVIDITSPDVDPSSSLVELPDTVIDPTDQVVAGCAAAEGNSFTIAGRGGLPETPTEIIRGQNLWEDLQDFSTAGEGYASVRSPQPHTSASSAPDVLVEATGWVINADGQVALVAALSDTDQARGAAPDCGDLRPQRDSDLSARGDRAS
ncbi:MAG: S-layer family protein [Cyanothece sp. SIO1E1]|nr:S-layer family protein [Cyanothece sp. SIO1E1]